MTRRLPSPEEYGRRLASARRRGEKRQKETEVRREQNVQKVLGELGSQREAVMQMGDELKALSEVALTADGLRQVLGVQQSLERISRRVVALETELSRIEGEVPVPAPPPVAEVPSEVREALDDLLRLARFPSAVAPSPSPPPSGAGQPQKDVLSPQQTIFAGPITLRVTGRDNNGDISDVRVEPTRH